MPECVIDLFSEIVDNGFGFFQKVATVSKIMTKQVHTLTLDSKCEEALQVFQRHNIHHAPVLADDDEVVGVISDRDLLRIRPPLLGKAAQGDDDHLVMKNTVSKFMSRGVVFVGADSSPLTALSLMIDHHIDSVLVHDADKQLEGILTPRDFMKLVILFHQVCTHGDDLRRFRVIDLDLSRGLPLDMIFSRGARSVRDVMTKQVHRLSANDSIDTAIKRMKAFEVRHLPVVDGADRLVGMVSDHDILRALPTPTGRRTAKAAPEFREKLFAVADARSLRAPVASIMEENPTIVRPNDLFTSAINIFLGESIRGLAVMETDTDRLCGIVTTTDVLRVIRITLQIGAFLETPRISSAEWEQAINCSD